MGSAVLTVRCITWKDRETSNAQTTFLPLLICNRKLIKIQLLHFFTKKLQSVVEVNFYRGFFFSVLTVGL